MKKRALLALMVLLWLPLWSVMAQADEADLQLHLRRTFGYQGGNSIQGSFSLHVSGDYEFIEVIYLIDDKVLVTVSEAPFRASFSTSRYEPGEHTLRAIVTNVAGEELESQFVRVTFITAEEGWQTAGRIAAWILGGVLIIMLVGMFGTGFLSRGRGRFELGVYGAAGGAVCKRCELPFARHVLSPNLLFGKLERCPHCGRVAIAARASRNSLEEAEARYREDQMKGQREIRGEEENFKQRLDDSRYEG
jgi:rRNA maturation protein Nop10